MKLSDVHDWIHKNNERFFICEFKVSMPSLETILIKINAGDEMKTEMTV